MTEHNMTVSPWGIVAPSARRTMRVCPEVGGQGGFTGILNESCLHPVSLVTWTT
jgi:hypothetical protein